MLTSVHELMKEVSTGGSLGSNKHALVEFVISSNMSLTKGKVKTLNFREVNLQLFKYYFNVLLFLNIQILLK